jgi:hypothetical protein
VSVVARDRRVLGCVAALEDLVEVELPQPVVTVPFRLGSLELLAAADSGEVKRGGGLSPLPL